MEADVAEVRAFFALRGFSIFFMVCFSLSLSPTRSFSSRLAAGRPFRLGGRGL
jgi:hypothetical protein